MGKKKTVWFNEIDQWDEAAYLRKMAADGWILEDMTHLAYVFREDVAENYFYQIEKRERYLSEEEREALAADGWQEVCHYELRYVYCKKGEGEAEAMIESQITERELDRKIREEEGRRKQSMTMGVVTLVLAVIFAVAAGGFSKVLIVPLLLLCVRVLPRMAFDHAASSRRIRKLEEKKEDLADGTYEKEDTYCSNRRLWQVIAIVILVLIIGKDLYYGGHFNEKGFALPEEISYAEVPAVRLEKLIDEPLTRVGMTFDPSLDGIRFETDRAETFNYDVHKKWGQIENYGTDYKYLPGLKKKLETKQRMKNKEGTEWELDTMYTCYKDEERAKNGFFNEMEIEEKWKESWEKIGSDAEKAKLLSVENDFFDILHVCRTESEYVERTSYHMLCCKGAQLMTVDYTGDERTEDILKEVEKVFSAQK